MAEFSGDDLSCLRGDRLVFRRLGFALDPGAMVLLVGPNGSGKSSLLRVMAGLTRPFSGRLLWRGAPATPETLAQIVRYCGHLDGLKPGMATRENLAFWARLFGGDVDAALAGLDLAHLADLPARFLSSGQKRRLALARLLLAPPPVWLLDEPTTALDRDSIARLEALVAAHRAGGGIVVASTHSDFAAPGAAVLNLADFAAASPFAEDKDFDDAEDAA